MKWNNVENSRGWKLNEEYYKVGKGSGWTTYVLLDEVLLDGPLLGEAATWLNIVYEQLEWKMKELTNLNGEIVALCQVEDMLLTK